MQVTEGMYTTLFNGITDARAKLEEAITMLNDIQLQTEKLYIDAHEIQ